MTASLKRTGSDAVLWSETVTPATSAPVVGSVAVKRITYPAGRFMSGGIPVLSGAATYFAPVPLPFVPCR